MCWHCLHKRRHVGFGPQTTLVFLRQSREQQCVKKEQHHQKKEKEAASHKPHITCPYHALLVSPFLCRAKKCVCDWENMIWANQTPQLRGEIDQDLIIEVEIVVQVWLISEWMLAITLWRSVWNRGHLFHWIGNARGMRQLQRHEQKCMTSSCLDLIAIYCKFCPQTNPERPSTQLV